MSCGANVRTLKTRWLSHAGAYKVSYSFADMIAQKIRHCDEQINHVIPGFYANYAFHMFMTDEPLGEVV